VRLRPLQAQDAGSDILLEDSSAVSAVSYASDGLLLAAGTEKGVIRLWNSETRALERSLKGHSQWVSGLGFAPDGGKLYSISEDGSARIWNVSDGSQAQLLELNEPATSMALDPLGLFWAIGTRSGRVYFWDLQKAQWAGSLHIGAQPILALAFSPDGATLALGDQSGQLQLWLVRSETGQVAVFPAGDPQNTGVLASGVCTPYNSSVAAAQQGGVLMADSTTRLDWEFSYSGDCSALAAASLAGSADQPDLNEITLRHTPHSSGGYDRLHISAVINLPKVPRDYEYTWELHAPGKTTTLTAKFTLIKPAKVNLPAPLYFVSEDSALLRLETDGRTQTPVIEASVQCMDISADGQIAYLSEDSLMLADANGGERRALLPIAGCPAWSPDGTRIAYVLNGVKVLDIASGEIKTLDMDVHAYGTNVRRYRSIVEWSPNNDKLIASVSGWEFWGNVLFDKNTGEHFGLQGETFTWSRDGALVYSARPMLSCYDGSTPSLLRTNVSTQEVETLLGNSETDLTGAFKPYETPDGRLMAFVDHDQGEMDCSGDIDVNLMLFPAQVSLNAPGEYRADQAISVLVSQLRDVLWWRDGSAAILSLAEDAQPFSATYQLVQPFAGADSRYLPIRGTNLRWAP